MDEAGGGGRVVLSVLSIMRGLILALGFCFSFVHPAVAGGPVEKMLGFFDRLRQAETEQAAHRPVPHVETRFTEGEVNDYMVHALKTTPRPGVKSIHVEFTDGNYMATTVVADLDALERWKPGTIPGALRWALSGTKSLRVDLRFRQTTDKLVGLSVEKAYYQDLRIPALVVEEMMKILAARQPEHYDMNHLTLPMGLRRMWTTGHSISAMN
jgi:hypothetical protein